MALRILIYKSGSNRYVPKRKFRISLKSAWRRKVSEKVVSYDPVYPRSLALGPYRVFHLPERKKREKETLIPEVARPHKKKGCRFCGEKTISGGAVFDLNIEGHEYFLMVNAYPLTSQHFMFVRADQRLSQHIQDERDLHHLLCMHQLFPLRSDILFSSNPGKNADAGASQNHWHAHIYPFADPIRSLPVEPLGPKISGVSFGAHLEWPACLRVFQGDDLLTLSTIAFRYISHLNHSNRAYNIALLRSWQSLPRVVVIPRGTKYPARRRGILPAWAGMPHCGTIFEISRRNFKAMRHRRKTAQNIIRHQLEETTLPPDRMENFDRIFRDKVASDE